MPSSSGTRAAAARPAVVSLVAAIHRGVVRAGLGTTLTGRKQKCGPSALTCPVPDSHVRKRASESGNPVS